VRAGSLRLSEADREHLAASSAILGVELTPQAVLDLARFADVLDLWSRKTNLISCRSSRELVDRHLLDSLAVAPLVPDSGTIIDLGSGAGFPGVPLAVSRANQRWVLVEARRKRASFLQEVRRTLGLRNVEIVAGRAEDPPALLANCAAAVVSRAVWPGEELLRIAEGWLNDEGIVLRMRSHAQETVFNHAVFPGMSTVQYQIGSDRMRSVDVLKRVSRETATLLFHVKQ